MLAKISKFALNLFGWNTSGSLPQGVDKAILIVAPHTSNWDFIIGRLTFWASKVRIRVLIKKEVFFFPFGPLLRSMGAVPVARGKKNNMVDEVAHLLNTHDKLVVVITPEGTRQLSRKWKKGFYLIAMEAKVPIALAFIDYKSKTGGVGPLFTPTGDYEKDMQYIQEFYKSKTARHPEKFSLSPQNLKK